MVLAVIVVVLYHAILIRIVCISRRAPVCGVVCSCLLMCLSDLVCCRPLLDLDRVVRRMSLHLNALSTMIDRIVTSCSRWLSVCVVRMLDLLDLLDDWLWLFLLALFLLVCVVLRW